MAKTPRPSHGAAWVRQGFALIEAYESAQRERAQRAQSDDPNAVAEAVLEGPADTPILPASGDLFAFPEISARVAKRPAQRGRRPSGVHEGPRTTPASEEDKT